MFSAKIDKQKFKEVERRREFREEAKNRLNSSGVILPSFSRQTYAGRIFCTICERDYGEPISFKLHVKEPWHKEKLQTLKDELAVQRAVNEHIRKLLDEEADDGMRQNKETESGDSLGKRPLEGVLVMEERIVEDKEEGRNLRNLLDYEDFDQIEETEAIGNTASTSTAHASIPQNSDIKQENAPKQDLAKSIIKEKEHHQEEKLRSRLEQMKNKVREKAKTLGK